MTGRFIHRGLSMMPPPERDPRSLPQFEGAWETPWAQSSRLGMQALERGRWHEAELAFGEALVLAPRRELPELYALRGFVRLRSRRPDDAIDDANACLAEMPDHHEALAWRGMARAMLGSWDEAIDDLSRAEQHLTESRRVVRDWLDRTVGEAVDDWKREACRRRPTAEDFARRARWYLAIDDAGRSERDLAEATRGDALSPVVLDAMVAFKQRQGELRAALEASRVRVDRQGTDPRAWRQLAEVAIRVGERRTALSAADHFQRLLGASFAERFEAAVLWRVVGDRLRSLSICDELVARGESSPSLSLLRGELFMDLRCWNSAAETWKERLNWRPPSVEDRLQLGRCLMKLRRFEEASIEFEEAIRTAPTHPEAHAGLGHARWSLRDLTGARAAIEKALRLDTMHLPSRVIAAHLDLGVGNLDEAYQTLESAWEREVRDGRGDADWVAECAFAAGVAVLERGQSEAALRWFDRAIERRPDHPGTWVWRAKAWARRGRLDRCRRDLMRAIRLHPSCESQYRKLGRDLARDRAMLARLESSEGDLIRSVERAIAWEMAEAWDELDRALPGISQKLKAAPSQLSAGWRWELRLLEIRHQARRDPRPLSSAIREALRRANSRERLVALLDDVDPRHWDEAAAEALEKQLREVADEGRIAHHLGAIYFEKSRWKKAHKWMTRALAAGYIEAETLAIGGAACARRGERQGAIRLLSLALERHPNQPQWLAWRGESRLRCRMFDEAATDFEMALTLDPQQVSAYAGLGMVRARRGDWEGALRWITQAFHRFKDPRDIATLLRCRARVFFNMRRYRRAMEDWDAATLDTPDDRELADLYFARAVAGFHVGEMEGMRLDLDRCLLRRPGHRGARAVVDWLENRTERFPIPLTPPGRAVAATRPAIAQEGWEMRDTIGTETRFPFNQWMLRKSSGKEFGPVSEGTLREWVREGRVAADDWLLRGDWNRWRRAAVVGKSGGDGSASAGLASSDSQEISLAGPPIWSPKSSKPDTDATRTRSADAVPPMASQADTGEPRV